MPRRDEILLEVRARHLFLDYFYMTCVQRIQTDYAETVLAARYYLEPRTVYVYVLEYMGGNTLQMQDFDGVWSEKPAATVEFLKIHARPGQAAVLAGSTALRVLSGTVEEAQEWAQQQIAMMRTRMAVDHETF